MPDSQINETGGESSCDVDEQRLDDNAVVIVGGGPVGLIFATVLAKYGLRSIIFERNESTTRWPKMDLTNGRSMELLQRLGLTDDIRKLGVPDTTPYRVLFLSGLHAKAPITSWDFPCVRDLKRLYREQNDGKMPLEPWQRISQAVFERYLKGKCDENPLIECRYGWKVEHVSEFEHTVSTSAIQVRSGKKVKVWSRYVAGCDGASSRVRRGMGIPLKGGPVPGYTLLVHFRSQDLNKLFRLGRFWHLFVCNKQGLGSAAISQDDAQIFTIHLLLPPEANHEEIESHDAVYQALGGLGGPFKFEIDEILVRSTYRHSIAVAQEYRSPGGRIFLAGDSAHQNIPTGGYGMNMGIGDAFDLGWKIAAFLRGFAGPGLLDSYEQERRPVALLSIQQSGIHMEAHLALGQLLGPDPCLVDEDTEAGRTIRHRIHQHYLVNQGENTDVGIEMDHRHKSCVYPSPTKDDGLEPSWSSHEYVPSTFIGSRAPHLFLTDGTAIFDHFGEFWTLIEFSTEEHESVDAEKLLAAGRDINMPIKHVVLHNEEYARKIWERRLVLVRPDGHVAWRGDQIGEDVLVVDLVTTITGYTPTKRNTPTTDVKQPFAATQSVISQVEDYQLDQMGIMQQ